MSVTATSSMARAIASAIALVSESATFQTRVGAIDATAALASIYGYEGYQPGEEVRSGRRPCAIIDFGERFEWKQIAPGCLHIALMVSGEVVVIIEDNTDKAWLTEASVDDYNDSLLDFSNFCGGVMDDMNTKLHEATAAIDSFGFQSIAMLSPPTRTEPGARVDGNDYWFAVFMFSREGV